MPPPHRLNPLYTPAYMASLRHDYTQTNEPMWSIAARHGIATRTFEHIVKREDWPRRRERVRRLIPAQHLLDEANALAAAQMLTSPPPGRGRSASRVSGEPGGGRRDDEGPPPGSRLRRSPPSPLQGEGDNEAAGEPPSPIRGEGIPATPEPPPPPDPAERIERLVIREIEIEEARREKLNRLQRPTAEAAQTARTLAILTQTLYALRRLHAGADAAPREPEEKTAHDDLPKDLDEFRRELARRIDAFVASRTDARDAASDPAPLGASA